MYYLRKRSNYPRAAYRVASRVATAAGAYAAKKVLDNIRQPSAFSPSRKAPPTQSYRLISRAPQKTPAAKKRKGSSSTGNGSSKNGGGNMSSGPGHYQRRYRAKSKKPSVRFAKYGSVKKIENGGNLTVQAGQCLYVGHGVAVNQVVAGVCRAIVKELFHQAGNGIDKWSAPVECAPPSALGDLMFMNCNYKLTPANDDTQTVGFEFRIVSTDTYEQVANNLYNAFTSAFTAKRQVEIQDFRLYRRLIVNEVDGNHDHCFATIRAKQMYLDFNVLSLLQVQNFTPAGGGSVEPSTKESTISIYNNPLTGKLYETNRPLNGFMLKVEDEDEFNNTFIANKSHGMIFIDSEKTLPTILQKPPKPWVFRTNKVKQVRCDPGGIIENKIIWKQKVSLASFFVKFDQPINDQGQNHVVPLGKAALFGLEKMLNQTRSTGVDIKIGYEVNQIYNVGYTYKRIVATPAILDIGAAPLS